MSIKAIVFDKDGTLIDYSSYWYYVGMAATEHAYRMLGITDIPEEEIEAHVRELGVTKAYTDIEGGLPLGVNEFFDKIIGYRSGMRAKPAPDIMLDLLAERGLKGNEVMMVGDTRTDVFFAKNSGTVSIGVGKDERSRELLLSYGADYVLRDLSDVPSLLDTL